MTDRPAIDPRCPRLIGEATDERKTAETRTAEGIEFYCSRAGYENRWIRNGSSYTTPGVKHR